MSQVSSSSTIAPVVVPWKPGPVTASRQRITKLCYVALVLVGLLPYLLESSSAWRAAGAGLWLPGGGFIAVGGWAFLLFPLTVLLFLVAFFAWFGSGMSIAPPIIWLGSAAIAGAMAPSILWRPGPIIAAALAVLLGLELRRRSRARIARDTASAIQSAAILPKALQDAAGRAAPKPAPETRELTDEELGGARYILDRALQPVDKFDGFDLIDIFQTSAVRYQINFAGYALNQLQAFYTPNFHGYLSLAQRNLIEKYLQRRVWNYWVYESAWGHLNFTDWNPAAKDNIMLTGYYGAQVAMYTGVTGDVRYEKPGSLTFRLNESKAWPHDVHSITQSVYDNAMRSAFCLYPCEPNWIYPGCNFRGMMTLAAHDLVYNSNFVPSIRDRWLQQLDREFTNAAGNVIALRSSLTGIELPFPASDLSYCTMANVFAPNLGRKMWALVAVGMRQMLGEEGGKPILEMPNTGIDFGNYQRGALAFAMGSLQAAAHEFGDEELAAAAGNTLDLRCARVNRDGVVHHRGSNLANLMVAAGRITRRDDIRDHYNKPLAPAVRTGPLLELASYPEVLVARAMSRGHDLDLVVVPGKGPGRQTLGLARLVAGRRYQVQGQTDIPAFTADQDGRANIDIDLTGRTRLRIVPAV